VEKIPLIAGSDAPVLILGETGTGKELFARAIHYYGLRQGKPFIPVNCGAIPVHLFENELFGHSKGAFTDASCAEKGLVAEAEGGTLFLDEVDALNSSAQIKLLRFLQDRTYRPLGSSRSLEADVRILAATNTDLRQRVGEKAFRDDLYHRLNVLSLTIPPLRERPGDIARLANHFLARQATGTHKAMCLSADAVRKLEAYPWMGNVRELAGVIERAVTMNPGGVINASGIDLAVPDVERVSLPAGWREAKRRAVGEFERSYLTNLLTTSEGNISRAAKAAGKERRTFQRLLRKYGLDGHAFRKPSLIP
jgi:DNA-binding NtrC family response regulator